MFLSFKKLRLLVLVLIEVKKATTIDLIEAVPFVCSVRPHQVLAFSLLTQSTTASNFLGFGSSQIIFIFACGWGKIINPTDKIKKDACA